MGQRGDKNLDKSRVTDNKLLILFVVVFFLFGVYFSVSQIRGSIKYQYTFDSYQYSYDRVEWANISKEELQKNTFYTEEALYIKAMLNQSNESRATGVQNLAIETNDIGMAATCAGKLLFNDLYKGSQHKGEYVYGNVSEIKIIEIENKKDLYNYGVEIELRPYEYNGGFININILALYSNDDHEEFLTMVAFEKVLLGVVLIALGSLFLLTLSSALRDAKSLEFRYYQLGAASIFAGVFVLFLTNYYSTAKSDYSSMIVQGSYILVYSLTITYAVMLYDNFVMNYPNRKSYFKIVIVIGTLINGLLVANVFTMTISNRAANYIFAITNFSFVMIAIVEFIIVNIKKLIRKEQINVGYSIITAISLFSNFMLLVGINEVLQSKLSIVANLVYFKIYVFFDIVGLIIYTFESRKLTKESKAIKEKAEKAGALTNMLLDMNNLLINLETPNIKRALSDAVDILNMYLPELIFWESLILDLEKPKRFKLTKEDRMSLETALKYVLVCSEVIINSEVAEVGTESELIFVGACPNSRELIGKNLCEEYESLHQKLISDEPIDKDEYIVKSRIPQFSDVFIYINGLSKFKPDHRKQVVKNFELAFETIENILIQNEMKRNQKQIIYDLTTISETKSKETYFHVTRVVNYTRVLAEGLGFSKEEVELVSIASAMHDIGKIATPYEILHKDGPLNDIEFREIQKHTMDGYHILQVNEGDLFHAAAIIARDHHEKYNGKGYRGVKGDDIHIYARIVALADVFDALASERAYKQPWSLDKVMNLIISESGEHFDPKVVEVFLNRFNEFLDIKRKYVD